MPPSPSKKPEINVLWIWQGIGASGTVFTKEMEKSKGVVTNAAVEDRPGPLPSATCPHTEISVLSKSLNVLPPASMLAYRSKRRKRSLFDKLVMEVMILALP